jgi:hypothetical protein
MDEWLRARMAAWICGSWKVGELSVEALAGGWRRRPG